MYTISFTANHGNNTIDISLTDLKIGEYFMVDYAHTYAIAVSGSDTHHLTVNKTSTSLSGPFMSEMTFLTKDRFAFVVGSGFGVIGYVVTLLYTRTDS